MKKYILGVCAIALAIGFSAFTPKNVSYFTYDPSSVTNALITDAGSYSQAPVLCNGSSAVPCKIDIDGFSTPADYVSHLNGLVDDAARLADFQGRATAGQKP